MTKKELWLRMKNYHFEDIVPPNLWEKISAKFEGMDASTKAFADKIATKYNWNKKFTLIAIYEYKKFVFLGQVNNFYVTPSKVIDIIWHEHILFSKAYRLFCNNIIETDFDHFPQLIALEEQTYLYHLQYEATINSYLNEFGYEAPNAIWGITKYEEDDTKKGSTTLIHRFSPYNNDPIIFEFNSETNFYDNYPEFRDGGEYGSESADWGDDSDSGDGSGDGGCSGGCGGGD